MGLEPAFSRAVAWPLAGPAALPLEPDDPVFAIQPGSLKSAAADSKTLAGANGEFTARPVEPLGAAQPRTQGRNRKWSAAFAASCLLHATVALAFLAAGPQDISIAGADEAGITLLGSAPENQASAGERAPPAPDVTQVTLVTMLDPRPVETVQAQRLPAAEALLPVEGAAVAAPVTETLEPIHDAGAQPPPPERVGPTDAEPAQAAMADPVQEILTARTVASEPDENAVQKPVETVAPRTPAEPAEAAPVETTQRIEAEAEPVVKLAKTAPIPISRPPRPESEKRPARKVEETPRKKERARKPAARNTQAGSGGRDAADTRRGAADGRKSGTTAATGRGKKRSAAGNAAVSNYPGKVAAKLRRAARGISRSARAEARNDVRVSFVVAAGGGVGGVRLTRSSGSPDLDQAALAVVRRAAPFPPIPPQAGRSSWAFSLPLGVAR